MYSRPHESLSRKGKTHENCEKENDLMKEELKASQDKIESLERDHTALENKDDKPLNEHEMTLQEFITTGLERTKLASMIYGVIKSKG